MANTKLALLLLAVVLAVSATPIAYGLLYKGVNIVGFRVRGRVVCSLSPNPPSSTPGIPGVNVRITCNGGSTSLAQALTDSKGFFDATVTTLDGLAFDQSSLPCVATVDLLDNLSCSVFPPKATIRSAVSLVGTVTQLAIGYVAECLTSVFVVVST